MLAEKVVLLQNGSVYEDMMIHLNKFIARSENTRDSYERDIRQFFQIMRNKDIENLTVEDLIFKKRDIQQYQNTLTQMTRNGTERLYANSSINRKIACLRSLYSELESNDYPVKSAWFDIDKLPEVHRSYGALTWEEVKKMIETVKDYPKGNIKAALIETAAVTSFRLESLLSMTWKDIRNIDGVWVLTVVGKGSKKDEKAISDELYEKLVAIKEPHTDRVFFMTKKTMHLTMKQLCKDLNIPDERNITFHSLKKTGIREVYHMTGGDILATAQQGAHESFATTKKHYLECSKDYSKMPSRFIGQEFDMSFLEGLTKEQIIELISECGRGMHIELTNKAKEKSLI